MKFIRKIITQFYRDLIPSSIIRIHRQLLQSRADDSKEELSYYLMDRLLHLSCLNNKVEDGLVWNWPEDKPLLTSKEIDFKEAEIKDTEVKDENSPELTPIPRNLDDDLIFDFNINSSSETSKNRNHSLITLKNSSIVSGILSSIIQNVLTVFKYDYY